MLEKRCEIVLIIICELYIILSERNIKKTKNLNFFNFMLIVR